MYTRFIPGSELGSAGITKKYLGKLLPYHIRGWVMLSGEGKKEGRKGEGGREKFDPLLTEQPMITVALPNILSTVPHVCVLYSHLSPVKANKTD